MADRFTRDEIATARRWVSAPPRNYVPSSAEIPRLREVIFAGLDALALVDEIARSGVELDDPRIGYVTVQIDRETWQAIRGRDDG